MDDPHPEQPRSGVSKDEATIPGPPFETQGEESDGEGLDKIVAGLKNQEQRMGSDFSFSQLLLDTAASGGKFTR